MRKIPVKGIPKDSVRIPQRYYLCSFDYNGNLLSKTPAPGDGAMITAGLDGRIYVSGLSVVSDIVYHQTPWFFRTTPEPTPGIWGFEPKSFKTHAKDALVYLKKYCLKDPSLKNMLHLSDIHKKNIALKQLDGIRIALNEAFVRNEMDEDKMEQILEQLNQPEKFIKKGNYAEAASAVEQAINIF